MLKSDWRKSKKKEKEKGIKTCNMKSLHQLFISSRNNLGKYHLDITWQVSTLKKWSGHILEMEGVDTIFN